jgi:dolichyl-phosphate beta-glucosyltransferase
MIQEEIPIQRPDISIVIPAYNEARRLPESIGVIKSYLANKTFSIEVIIVVEPSDDQTFEKTQDAIQDDPRFRCIQNKTRYGKGFAVRTGMLTACGKIVFYMDADLSTPLRHIDQFLEEFKNHPEIDCLVGSRADQKSRITKRQALVRRTLGLTFRHIVSFWGVRGVTDTQCGFKAFRQNCVASIFGAQKINGFAFDVEVLLLAQKQSYKIKSIPIEWINSPESKLNILTDSLKMLFDLFRVHYLVRKTLAEMKTLPLTSDKQAS